MKKSFKINTYSTLKISKYKKKKSRFFSAQKNDTEKMCLSKRGEIFFSESKFLYGLKKIWALVYKSS